MLPKIIFFLLTCCLFTLFGYYAFPSKEINVLNKTIWSDFEESDWTNAGDFEIKPFLTKVYPVVKDGRIKLEYNFLLELRYPKNGEIVESQLLKEYDQFKTTTVLSEDESNFLKDILIIGDGNSLYDENYIYLQESEIKFIASIFSENHININTEQGKQFLIRLNPFLFFRMDYVTFFLMFVNMILFLVLFVIGGFQFSGIILYLLFGIPIVFDSFSPYPCLFSSILIIYLLCNIKLWSIDIGLSFLLIHLRKYILISVTFFFFYLFLTRADLTLELALYSLLFACILSFFFLVFVYFSIVVFYAAYLYFFGEKQTINKFELKNYSSNMEGGTGKRFPSYSFDIAFNKKEMYSANARLDIVSKFRKDEFIDLKHFITDGKENYIFL